jgi:GDPmannose 4,6-dehydratase
VALGAGAERHVTGADGTPRDRVIVDPAFVRPPERWAPVGDPSRARDVLGWRPAYDFDALVAEMVAADLDRLRAAG